MHYPSINLCIHHSLAMFLSFPPFASRYIFKHHLSSPHLSNPPPPHPLSHTSYPTILSSTHLSVSLFFSSCSSRQPSWQQAKEVTSRRAWLFPPHRYTRWGRSTSTASHPLPWPRCRVSFIKPWVSTQFHSLSSCVSNRVWVWASKVNLYMYIYLCVHKCVYVCVGEWGITITKFAHKSLISSLYFDLVLWSTHTWSAYKWFYFP